jgi:hypothetical protein
MVLPLHLRIIRSDADSIFLVPLGRMMDPTSHQFLSNSRSLVRRRILRIEWIKLSGLAGYNVGWSEETCKTKVLVLSAMTRHGMCFVMYASGIVVRN